MCLVQEGGRRLFRWIVPYLPPTRFNAYVCIPLPGVDWGPVLWQRPLEARVITTSDDYGYTGGRWTLPTYPRAGGPGVVNGWVLNRTGA